MERRINVEEIRILRLMCGVTKEEKIRNEYVREIAKQLHQLWPVLIMRENKQRWFGYVMRRNNLVRLLKIVMKIMF